MENFKKIGMITLIVISLLLTSSAFAQNLVNKKESKEQNLNSIIVTAQKAEENLQDVAISMTVMDEFDIEDKMIKTIKDIEAYTPNLMFFSDGNGQSYNPTIRGLRTDSGADSSSLGMFIDGVPMLGSMDFNAIVMDIERIEVLKGPQSTLYGKGTQAGAINVITKKPDNEIKGKIGGEIGSDNKKEYLFAVSGPVVKDKLYIGLSGKHYEKDGLITNTYKGGQTDDRQYNFGKINIRYNPVEDLDISLISQVLKRKDEGVSWNPVSAASRENTSDVGVSEPQTLLNAFKIEYDFDKYKFESISTYKKFESVDLLRDFDFSSTLFYHSGDDSIRETYTQELRVSSKGERYNWLVGVNADKEERETIHFIESIDPRFVSRTENDYKSDSQGIFIHSQYSFNNALSLIGGLRYDKNNIDYQDKITHLKISNSFSEISPKIGLEYNLSRNSMVYTTVAKGYKPGGVYVFAAQGYPKKFDKETLWSYEVGSKNSFLNNTLVFNASVYYMKVDDMQVTTFVHESGSNNSDEYKSNAAKATSQGFEAEVSYKATANLKLYSSFGYNKTEFDEYKDLRGDFSGNTNPLAPEYNYNVGGKYRTNKGYYASVDLNGFGKMYLDRENIYKRDPYNLVNSKIGYEHPDFEIYLYAKNLFDEEYDSDGIYNGAYVIYSDPREIGIQLTYRF